MSEKLQFTLNGHRHTLVASLEYEKAPEFITYSPATLDDIRGVLRAQPVDQVLGFLYQVLDQMRDEDRERFLSCFDLVAKALKERDLAREDLDDARVVIDVLKGHLAEMEKAVLP